MLPIKSYAPEKIDLIFIKETPPESQWILMKIA